MPERTPRAGFGPSSPSTPGLSYASVYIEKLAQTTDLTDRPSQSTLGFHRPAPERPRSVRSTPSCTDCHQPIGAGYVRCLACRAELERKTWTPVTAADVWPFIRPPAGLCPTCGEPLAERNAVVRCRPLHTWVSPCNLCGIPLTGPEIDPHHNAVHAMPDDDDEPAARRSTQPAFHEKEISR